MSVPKFWSVDRLRCDYVKSRITYFYLWSVWLIAVMSLDVKLLCVLQDFLFHMINLWSSMNVSHLHMYAQLLRSSEWQLCFTRRYGSTVKVTVCACFCMKHKMISYVCITGHYAVSQGPYSLDERRAVNIMFLRMIFEECTLSVSLQLANICYTQETC